MKMPSHLSRLLCLALALVWTQGTQASTVFWANNVGDALYDSSGNSLDATFSFELGAFTGGFTPTYQNVDQWQANWQVIDVAFDPDSNGWNVAGQFYIGTIDFRADGFSESLRYTSTAAFTQGQVAYLWVFNSKNIVPSSEWALVTDGSPVGDSDSDWIIPDPADTGSSYNWSLVDAGSPIIGSVNGVRGPGDYSTTPGAFSLQTAVVPEPGSAFLIFAAAAAHLTRRFRRPTRMFLS